MQLVGSICKCSSHVARIVVFFGGGGKRDSKHSKFKIFEKRLVYISRDRVHNNDYALWTSAWTWLWQLQLEIIDDKSALCASRLSIFLSTRCASEFELLRGAKHELNLMSNLLENFRLELSIGTQSATFPWIKYSKLDENYYEYIRSKYANITAI